MFTLQGLCQEHSLQNLIIDAKLEPQGVLEDLGQALKALQQATGLRGLGMKKLKIQVELAGTTPKNIGGRYREDQAIIMHWQEGLGQGQIYILGHEWAHFLDHQLHQHFFPGKPMGMFSEQRPGRHSLSRTGQLLESLQGTPFLQQALEMDQGKKAYFSRGAELLARSFEDFLLSQTGISRQNELPAQAYLDAGLQAKNQMLWKKSLKEIQGLRLLKNN